MKPIFSLIPTVIAFWLYDLMISLSKCLTGLDYGDNIVNNNPALV